jgi:hypothetical protein
LRYLSDRTNGFNSIRNLVDKDVGVANAPCFEMSHV